MALVELFGATVEGKEGKSVDVATLSDNDVIGIYFSAHWCPPCRMFTPQLAEAYNDIVGQGKKFEIIFVSSDKDEESCKEYFDTMPWLIMPFSNRDAKGALSQKYNVTGIPCLILVNAKTGETISKEGRQIIGQDKKGDKFPWTG